MYDYQRMADLYKDLASAYEKINSFIKQIELMESLNKERYETLQSQFNISQASVNSLTNLLKEKEEAIEKLKDEHDYLYDKLNALDNEEEIGIYD
jgi:peptidoglycan hydrolase CwlO-like protein